MLRIKDWSKNIIIFLPLIFSGQISFYNNYPNLAISFIIFSFSASFIYIINDLIDVENDKLHPVKKHKKILANNALSKKFAFYVLIFILIFILFLVKYNNIIFYHILIYILLNFSYSLIFKKIEILDLTILSFGYVVRLDAGSLIIGVETSLLMIFAIFFLSFFIISLKRVGELNSFKTKILSKRFLNIYSKRNLKILTFSSAFSFLVCYSLFIVLKQIILIVTLPIVIYLIFRYYSLCINSEKGEYPIDIILKDKLIFFLSLSVMIFVVVLFVSL